MTAKAGRDWALSISSDGGATYTAVAGLRTRSFKAGNTNVDITNADSAGRWRELLGGAGVQTLEIDAAGIAQNDAGFKKLFVAATTSTLILARLATHGIQIDGSFLVDDFNAAGPYNEATTFDCKLQSSGQPTFTYS